MGAKKTGSVVGSQEEMDEADRPRCAGGAMRESDARKSVQARKEVQGRVQARVRRRHDARKQSSHAPYYDFAQCQISDQIGFQIGFRSDHISVIWIKSFRIGFGSDRRKSDLI